MSTYIHERRHRRDIPIQRARNRAPSQTYDRLRTLVDAACTAWLIEHCPEWVAEKANRGIFFGRAENREKFSRK